MTAIKPTAEEWLLERWNEWYLGDSDFSFGTQELLEGLKRARAEERTYVIEKFLDSIDTYLKRKGVGFPLKDAMIEVNVIIENLRRLNQ